MSNPAGSRENPFDNPPARPMHSIPMQDFAQLPVEGGGGQPSGARMLSPHATQGHRPRQQYASPYASDAPYADESSHPDYYDSDSAPLTSSAQPISGVAPTEMPASRRYSFQTGASHDNRPSRSRDPRMLGFDLEAGSNRGPNRRFSRSPSTTEALHRAGDMVRAMSQRVVNISGEDEVLEQQQRWRQSRSPSADGRLPSEHGPTHMGEDTSYPSQTYPPEKSGDTQVIYSEPSYPPPRRQGPMPNPLKGRSLGLFGPDNFLRKALCDVLVNPHTEALILLLIIFQLVLLAVEAAPDVTKPGNERPTRFVGTVFQWAMLGLFIFFSVELIARIIVSGFVLNAAEYSTIDRKRGVRAAIRDEYQAIFRPERQKPGRAPQDQFPGPPPPLAGRAFTMMQGSGVPETVEDHQRMQLARRAFLRHGFNRLDFVAVVSFWISFVMMIVGVENEAKLFIFQMLSSLRILRLLALTNGTAIILQSLKKATPLLIRVSFIIGFFWLIFAIIGVQSFKTSLSRTCVWVDPADPTNLTATFENEEEYCGGYRDNVTGEARPWVFSPDIDDDSIETLMPGAQSAKGFLCPRGSICLQQENPEEGTVSFDDVGHSAELIFIIMAANGWSDVMYWATSSDFLLAALFWGFGILIMLLWQVNLLIAVITSSFQVMREETKKSSFAGAQDPHVPVQLDERPRRKSGLQKIYEQTSLVWVAIITFGIVCQALRSASMSAERERFINNAEIVVTALLDVEILIRIVADFRYFHRSGRNLFDLFLAVVTSVILLPPIRNSGEPYAWLTGFQILRIYRVILAIPVTRNMILKVLGNVAGLGNLILFVFIMTFLMAILSSQLFRSLIPDDDDDFAGITFFSLFNSFQGMYQVLSSEDWIDILFNVTSNTSPLHTSWLGAIFLMGWFTLSFMILINMFIALIQENFDSNEDEKRLEQVRAFLQRKELGSSSANLSLSSIFTFGKSRKRRDPMDYGPATMEMLLKDAVVKEFMDDPLDPQQSQFAGESQSPPLGNASGGVGQGGSSSLWGRIRANFSVSEPNPFHSNTRFSVPNDTLDPREMARQAVTAASARRKAQRDYLARHPTYNNSLYIFTPQNPLRRLCQRIVAPSEDNERFDGVEPNKYAWYTFSAIMYASTVAMVVLACVTTPLYQREYFQTHDFRFTNWFVWVDLAFAVIFSVEAAIKIVADGLLSTPNAYLRNAWGVVDAVVLITLWINAITLLASAGAVSRAVGAFKALRALRLLNISKNTQETFRSLFINVSPKVMSAALVSVALLVPFAIYAVNLFSGNIVSCNDDDLTNLTDCFGEFGNTPFSDDWDLLTPRVASNPDFDFDDFGGALFILYQSVSEEGWMDVTYTAESITGRGLQPEDRNRMRNAVFFITFNLLATIFVLTLFISVLMRDYTEQTGTAFLTAEQRAWLELRKLLRQISPHKSSLDESASSFKRWCHKLAIKRQGKWYTAVTFILFLHLVLLMLEFYPEPLWWTRTRDVVLFVFNLIYIVNVVIRIVGLGWPRFRRSSWDVFSLLAVSGAFATTILFAVRPNFDTFIQLRKIFLVAIVFMLIPRNDALDRLFKTAAASFTTIMNMMLVWMILYVVFAIALTQAFSLTKFGDEGGPNINFRTVPKALILLFRTSIGEGWNDVMEDFARATPPLCVDSANFFESDCGSPAWARVLLIAWNLISMYIFFSLFISLICESFSYVYQRSSSLACVDRDELSRFKEAWRTVDPAGTGYVSKEAFPRLVGELSGVFEMRIYDTEDSVHQILRDVRGDFPAGRSGSDHVDVQRLNRRLSEIDAKAVRERRHRFNLFFEEIMVSADPDKGISFTTVLMILAHYKVVTDSKCLGLEEFLRRRARLQRVEEEVRRRVIMGFFDTLYWSRKFRRHMEQKRVAQMPDAPPYDVPNIHVDQNRRKPSTKTAAGSRAAASPAYLDASAAMRPQYGNWPSSTDISTYDTSYAHPLSLPRASPSMQGQGQGQGQQRARSSFYGFETLEPGGAPGYNARRGSSVSPVQVRELLDDSVWVESIRRSATMRRPSVGRSPYR